jgi:riboflavin synthase
VNRKIQEGVYCSSLPAIFQDFLRVGSTDYKSSPARHIFVLQKVSFFLVKQKEKPVRLEDKINICFFSQHLLRITTRVLILSIHIILLHEKNNNIMFSGIVEEPAKVTGLTKEKDNLHIALECSFVDELKIDQSISHNGVCLTVVKKTGNSYTVTAIHETLIKSNLGSLKVGDLVNLERSMLMNGRIDGHIVQGHVDQTAVCTEVSEVEGSWYFTFEYDNTKGNVTVEKGSISVNGVSLTVVNSRDHSFQVAIIPYTYENTNFKEIRKGTIVNLEFDIIGKYIQKIVAQQLGK